MIVVVEWMDGEVRRYEKASRASTDKTGSVLTIYNDDGAYYGQIKVLAALPTANIREWKTES